MSPAMQVLLGRLLRGPLPDLTLIEIYLIDSTIPYVNLIFHVFQPCTLIAWFDLDWFGFARRETLFGPRIIININ